MLFNLFAVIVNFGKNFGRYAAGLYMQHATLSNITNSLIHIPQVLTLVAYIVCKHGGGVAFSPFADSVL